MALSTEQRVYSVKIPSEKYESSKQQLEDLAVLSAGSHGTKFRYLELLHEAEIVLPAPYYFESNEQTVHVRRSDGVAIRTDLAADVNGDFAKQLPESQFLYFYATLARILNNV